MSVSSCCVGTGASANVTIGLFVWASYQSFFGQDALRTAVVDGGVRELAGGRVGEVGLDRGRRRVWSARRSRTGRSRRARRWRTTSSCG